MLSFILALLPLVSAANTFIGCSSTTGGTITSSTAGLIRSSDCAASCASGATTAISYSYYYTQGPIPICECSITPPEAASYDGSAFGGSDSCNGGSDRSVYRLGTTFNFNGCYESNGIAFGTSAFRTDSINTCFDACRTSRGLIVSPDSANNNFRCLCAADAVSPTTQPRSGCAASLGLFYFFTHPAPAASAGLNRRRQLRLSPTSYCPGSMTACRIEGSEDGYECLDTASELESCGGCVFGTYGTTSVDAEGVNCAELAGDDFGSMTCKMGQCVEGF